MSQHGEEVARGERFRFGENWQQFLSTLSEERISEAQKSLRTMLEIDNLHGLTFVDVGCGSGIFSLAARRLGASVFSFDYDPASVASTSQVKEHFYPANAEWTVEQGSVLDTTYLARLGQFDIVYSWGVLHHTGEMWKALANVIPLVKDGGTLFIAIYNDQGRASKYWKAYKRLYNRVPKPLQLAMAGLVAARFWSRTIVRDTLRGRPRLTWRNYKQSRGMSAWHDIVDWAGGYPFEVAKPEEILEFYRRRGFTLTKMTTQAGAIGCNEFVFSLG